MTWHIFEEYGNLKTKNEDQSRSLPFFQGFFALFFVILLAFIIRDWSIDLRDVAKNQRLRSKSANFADEEDSSGKQVCFVLMSNWVEVVFVAGLAFVMIGGRSVLWISLLVLLGILVLREFVQLLVSIKRYFCSPENWIEVSMIILLATILLVPESTAHKDLKRHLSAFTIVLSWAELITLVAKHPRLTRYNVYVTMLYRVMTTFVYFLSWYVFFIIAFGLGFYIMLHSEENTDYIFFNSPWLALVKTSTMFVGELEFSDIPVDLESKLSPLGYIFFLGFVFLIVVVLMNLLNGLAVSDTGVIRKEAEIVSYVSRVGTISYTEAVLLGDPFNFLSNWPVWLAKVPSCSLCRQMYKSAAIKRLFHKLTGATGILLFYKFLPNKKLVIRPNERRRECGFMEVS